MCIIMVFILPFPFLQEILISDTRYKSDPVNKRCNVFSNIVLPMGLQIDENNQHSVQAEIHAR